MLKFKKFLHLIIFSALLVFLPLLLYLTHDCDMNPAAFTIGEDCGEAESDFPAVEFYAFMYRIEKDTVPRPEAKQSITQGTDEPEEQPAITQDDDIVPSSGPAPVLDDGFAPGPVPQKEPEPVPAPEVKTAPAPEPRPEPVPETRSRPASGSAAPAAPPATGRVASESFSASGKEQQMVDLINDARRNAGLPALAVSGSLTTAARAKSKDMVDRNYFSHTSPTYGSLAGLLRHFGISCRSAGENLAMNSSGNVSAAHNLLMNSSSHRANILNRNYNYVGVGIHIKSDGSHYYTQLFIQR